jgi:hypothetical protein
MGDAAGRVSSYLWLLSGGVDVAMCCWKLHEYRTEMRDTLEQMKAASAPTATDTATRQKELVSSGSGSDGGGGGSIGSSDDAKNLLQSPPSGAVVLVTRSPAQLVPPLNASSSFPFVAAAPGALSTDGGAGVVVGVPSSISSALVPSASSSLSLCSSACDVDCVHIEALRLFRYVGELGLSVCGVLELLSDNYYASNGNSGNGQGSLVLEAVMESSGLLSALATFVKRGATHARSKRVEERMTARAAALREANTSSNNDDAATEQAGSTDAVEHHHCAHAHLYDVEDDDDE